MEGWRAEDLARQRRLFAGPASLNRPVAIFDVDGTVADARHRLRLIAGNADHEHWLRFFEAAVADPPIPEGLALARTLAGGCDLIWVTGRPEWSRTLTLRWLAAHGLPATELLMYPPGERRPARAVKLHHITAIGGSRRIVLVVDDDPRAVASLRESGLPALLATWVPWSDPAALA